MARKKPAASETEAAKPETETVSQEQKINILWDIANKYHRSEIVRRVESK